MRICTTEHTPGESIDPPDGDWELVSTHLRQAYEYDDGSYLQVAIIAVWREREDGPALGDFGTDPRDSASLQRLYEIIDTKLGWRDVEQQEGGDYEARIVEVAEAVAVLRRMWSGAPEGPELSEDEMASAHDALNVAVFPSTPEEPESTEPVRYFWTRWEAKASVAFELLSPWWISGETFSGDRKIFCAAIIAGSEQAARDLVVDGYDESAEDPEIEFTTCNEKTGSPFTDRFPRADWMVWP